MVHLLSSIHSSKTNSTKAWWKDKLESNRFGLKAIYRPASFIPEEIWKACPATTNGNEQAHRDVNRDGTNLTLLGGIMQGKAYDNRAAASIHTHQHEKVYTRDQTATHTRRASRSIARLGNFTSIEQKPQLILQCLSTHTA